MYNPSTSQGSDSYNEWIELYNNNSYDINLSGWKLCGTELLPGYINHTDFNIYLNTGFIIPPNSYVIITDGGTGSTRGTDFYNDSNIDKNSTAFHVNTSSICGSLSNSGDLINLSNGTFEQIFNYTYLVNLNYADGDGNSLQLINETWYAGAPTPGYKNTIEEIPTENGTATGIDIELTVKLSNISYILQEYTQLFNIKILNKDCGIKDNVTVFYNISKNNNLIKQEHFSREVGCSAYANTGSITFNHSGNYTICGLITDSTINDTNKNNDFACKNIRVIDTRTIQCNISINITTDKNFYLDNESIKFHNNLNDKTFPYIIEYWVEDLFGNIYKKKYNTTNTNQKSYSPKISEQDLVLLIKNHVYALCNDSNISDNYAENMIIVKNTNPQFLSTEGNSSLEITKIYDLGSDKKAKFGQTIRVKVDIYKGDTTKTSISIRIEDNNGNKLSKETKTNAYQKYMNYILTLPVQIKPNCGYDYEDGTYKLIIEGLGEMDSENIEIEGITKDLCEKTSIEKVTQTRGSFTYALADAPNEVYSGEEFTVQIKLKNDDDEKHKATVWSYVYRGSKCYCTGREENQEEISISPEKEKIVTLKNKVIGAEPGNYKLKVKIIKDNQKTIRELTREIKVVGFAESSSQSFFQNQPSEETSLESTKYPNIVYESTNIKAKKLIPIFIIILLTILSAVLLWKR